MYKASAPHVEDEYVLEIEVWFEAGHLGRGYVHVDLAGCAPRAWSYCRFVLPLMDPLYTRSTNICGDSFSETTMQPNPMRTSKPASTLWASVLTGGQA
jgi:hypothetical protein